jgi:hyperosmotically inducible periplasmic protein
MGSLQNSANKQACRVQPWTIWQLTTHHRSFSRIVSSLSSHFASILLINALVGGAAQLQAFQQPDNTKINERDRDKSQKTADQAKEGTSDRELMQKIRKAVVADKSLSTYGHNVKIISEHGKVTLKGPVHSEEESKNIEAKAVAAAGAGNVSNQLLVKGGSPARVK